MEKCAPNFYLESAFANFIKLMFASCSKRVPLKNKVLIKTDLCGLHQRIAKSPKVTWAHNTSNTS